MPSIIEDIISYGIQTDQVIRQLAAERDNLRQQLKEANLEISRLKNIFVREPDNQNLKGKVE